MKSRVVHGGQVPPLMMRSKPSAGGIPAGGFDLPELTEASLNEGFSELIDTALGATCAGRR